MAKRTRPDSTVVVARRLRNIVTEFTDGAVVIGFTVEGEAFVVTHARDMKTKISLNAMLCQILHTGGVQFDQATPPVAPEIEGGD